jgi:hypothetical protein
MRLPRMTTQRWMVVALIVGLAMGGVVSVYRLKRRRDSSLSLLRYHGEAERLYVQYERSWRDSLQHTERMLNVLEDGVRRAGDDDALELKLFRRAAERERRYAADAARAHAYHAAMAHKYERAARYPWLPVEPDPPKLE